MIAGKGVGQSEECVAKMLLRHGSALYFSRATIPFDRDNRHPAYYKHLGFYAYRKSALDRFVALPESALEKTERLEQLRETSRDDKLEFIIGDIKDRKKLDQVMADWEKAVETADDQKLAEKASLVRPKIN